MTQIDGGEVLVRAMQAHGIETLFSISDIGQSPMLRSAEQAGMRLISPRHESAGVHMADAWARASGGLAAVAGAAGPGVANMVPGLVCASVEGVPLLAIGTQRVRRSLRAVRHGRFQYSPQLEVVEPVTKFAARVEEASRLPEFVTEAVRRALAGRPGPVFLEIPGDVLTEEVDEEEVVIGDPDRQRAQPGAPDPAAVAEAAGLLADSAFPVILAGHAVHRAGAAPALRAVAEHTGALVMTSAGARGAFPESHPQSIGMVFPWGSPAHLQADVVLAVGTQLGESTQYLQPPGWAGPDHQRVIHLDVDPLQIGVNREVDVALVGDADAGLSALAAALGELGPAREPGPEASAYASELAQFRQDIVGTYAEVDSAPVHPGRLAVELAGALPDDAVVCVDGGNTGLWAHLAISYDRPRSLLWTGHLGHLGTGLPYAIGAKLAAPERPVVLFTGDGAFGFNLQELETAARHGVPVVIVINCDYAWGMEELYMEKVAGTTVNVKQSEVRYDEVARALGCRGELVDQPDQLRPAFDRALAAELPTLIQVVVDDRENVHPPASTSSTACTPPSTPEPAVGSTAVVTGGAGGLGQAFTTRLEAAGYDVVPVDVAVDGAGSVRRLDVTDAEACRALAAEVRPEVWVNNAGVTGAGGLVDQDDETVERIVAVNLLGVIHGTRAAITTMAEDDRGVVVNVASLAGWAPTPHIAVYSATKHGVRAFSVAADAELGPGPPRVKCLLPDGIRTPMVDAADPGHLMSFTGRRLLEPDEVAAAGLQLIESGRVVATVPPGRGVSVRLLGIWPGLASKLRPVVEGRARRNRRREAARQAQRP